MMLAFSYFPYCCAEALDLSGITSILFAGIVMSHYAHQNLSLVTQEWILFGEVQFYGPKLDTLVHHLPYVTKILLRNTFVSI